MIRILEIVMLGATGAVGTEMVSTLVKMPELTRLTLWGWPRPNFLLTT